MYLIYKCRVISICTWLWSSVLHFSFVIFSNFEMMNFVLYFLSQLWKQTERQTNWLMIKIHQKSKMQFALQAHGLSKYYKLSQLWPRVHISEVKKCRQNASNNITVLKSCNSGLKYRQFYFLDGKLGRKILRCLKILWTNQKPNCL